MSEKIVRNLVVMTAFFLLILGVVLFYIFDKHDLGNNSSNKYVYYNVSDYIEISPVTYDDYSEVYSSVNVSKIVFKNISSEITDVFFRQQNEIIGYVIDYYNQIINIDNYSPTNSVYSDIKTQINGAVLSVFYRLNFQLDENIFKDSLKSYVITLNIDLGTNKVLTNDELLSKYSYSKSYIADKLFNDNILISKNQVVIDKNTNISLTRDDIKRKKEVYVNRIVSEFNDIVKIYIEENSLVLVYNTKDLKNIFFDNEYNTDIKIRYLK